ncbi:MAG: bifunctional ornithine acetyltransferase/N-acetylglutamate synthase [Treponema sp.]|jgi:glutamate N-acetyltransferase/amino-acid N-acetyltransferase|nr:bifunctional ornithine acetyltransferase/N-acetylglutamate synthase [Treponema sp.]
MVCAPRGFKAAGLWTGIKAGAVKRDLALICSERPCTAAAVFTTNRVKAASIIVSREHLEQSGGRVRAVIANSGNANACTGAAGLAAARRMAALAAEQLGIDPKEVAVASTGVIGVPLPIEKIEARAADLIAGLSLSHDNALEAIMTTDTRKKTAAAGVTLPSMASQKPGPAAGTPDRQTSAGPDAAIQMGAMAKGSGMIHPNMATMICIITTDAAITAPLLDRALRRAVNRSFNRLTVDGDMSTNDIALIMANGAAGNAPIESEGPDYEAFAAALEGLCVNLTRQMARDGEGAGRLLTVTVQGAAREEDAALLARTVAGSNLVKAACFGADANWGRVLCALGYAKPGGAGDALFEPEAVSVVFASAAGAIQVCGNGESFLFSEREAKRILMEEEIDIDVTVGTGPGRAQAWGCDLTYDYVRINGDYRS